MLLELGVLTVGTVGGAFWLASSAHNRLMALDERCDAAFADIDVLLKQRHNLIPSLVETVRGYMSHEGELITEVVRSRAEAARASGANMRLDAEMQLGNTLNSLLATAERYPELKASDHFRELRAELADAEHRIGAARRFFNLAVAEYNSTLRQFPGSLIGAKLHLARRRPFDLGVERVLIDEPIAVKF